MAETDLQALAGQERELLARLIQARARATRLQRELAEAEGEFVRARAALDAYYGQGGDVRASEPESAAAIKVWIAGVAYEVLAQHRGDLSEVAQGAIDEAPRRKRGFGYVYRLIARPPTLMQIADRLDTYADALEVGPTKKHKTDAVACRQAAEHIRATLRGEGVAHP